MAWREEMHQVTLPDGRVLVAGSFRGVPFRTVTADFKVGRRNVVHEYPQRDIPYVDDLGRRARRFVVEAYVVGDDYLDQRDALVRAFEEGGAGELIHPRYGILRVSIDGEASFKEDRDQNGIARISVTFVEDGLNNFPQVSANTVSQVEAATNAADEAAEQDFGEKHNVDGPSVLATNAIKGVSKSVEGVLQMARQATSTSGLSEVSRQVGLLTGNIAGLIRTPVVLVQSLRSIYASTVQELQRPLWAFQELQSVFLSNSRGSSTAGTVQGSSRARTVTNENARADLNRRLSLSNQARVLVLAISDDSQVATADQALTMRNALLLQIDIELDENDPPQEVTVALVQLRVAIVRDVATRAERLQRRSTFTPAAVLPALVVAHRVYQDATRADELADRNQVRNPMFMPARPLEILL